MKAKKYRLQTVLEIRNRAKDETARIVALRLHQLEEAEIELNNRRKQLQACYEKQNQAQTLMNNELNKGIQTKDVLAHQNFLNDLRVYEIELQTAVDKQIQTVSKAENEVEIAREKLMEAARDVKSIEIHKENWQTTQRTEINRKEEKLSDEIGAILHGRNKKSGDITS